MKRISKFVIWDAPGFSQEIYETHMIGFKNKHLIKIIFNRACELDEVNHVRFPVCRKAGIIPLKSKLDNDEN